MSQKAYLMILRVGVYASLFVVFLVFKNLLFPFITSKQIVFNMIVEALFAIWIAFVVKYPEYRPKRHYVWWGLCAFLAALVLSSVFGLDWNLSFWGDVERMLGVFHVLHFLAFYFIVITAFREWKHWRLLFILSNFCAIGVSYVGIEDISYSTIGNTAYVSGYLLFNIFFAALLFFREPNRKLGLLYFLPVLYLLYAFRVAGTSGAYVGLAASLVVLPLVYALFGKNAKLRLATLGIGALILLGLGVLMINREADWVANNPFLSAAYEIDFQKNTFQTRLISWRAALKDLPSHYLLGTGFGNFAVTFDKYFDPTFYNHTRSETYFDRAHNNVIDIASTSGLVGLLTYLSIFGAAGYYLVRGYRAGKIDIHELAILSACFTAYFVQNLAVFDSLVTYHMLMVTLAFLYFLYERPQEAPRPHDREWDNPEVYALAFAGAILAFVMYQYNIQPLQMLTYTIEGQRAASAGDYPGVMTAYRQALAIGTPLDRDSRTSLIRVFIGNPQALRALGDNLDADLLFLLDIAEKNVAYNREDSLNQMMLAELYNTAASLYDPTSSQFTAYSDKALATIDAAINASPGRVPVYFQKAQVYITRGDQDKALETLNYAASLNPDYYDSFCYLGRTYLFYEDEAKGYEYINTCLDKGGINMIAPAGLVKSYINHYAEKEDMPRLAKLYERLTMLEPTVENWTKLANLYATMGDKENAIRAAQKSIEVDPSVRQYAQEFIDSL